MNTDILIVGGGIGGAVLAELLGRAGKKVVVLEKSSGPPRWIRPELLWPATAELLFSLMPQDTWVEQAVLRLRGLEVFQTTDFVPVFTEEILESEGIRIWSTNPNQTRELLLGLPSFELRRGVEVTMILKRGGRITGVRARHVESGEEFEVHADWTVGDDGVHSLVRQACGIDIHLRLFPLEFLCFNIDWPTDFPPDIGRLWPNLGSAKSGIVGLGGVPVPNDKGAGLVVVRGTTFSDNADVRQAWAQLCTADSRISEIVGGREFPKDFVHIKRPWGHAPRYGVPGAVLMGDAAHPVSPAGGQGANMSVADAVVLAELILGGAADLVSEYERRRRPANQRSLRPTRAGALLQGLPNWSNPTTLCFALAAFVGRHPTVLRRLVRFTSTAFQERKE